MSICKKCGKNFHACGSCCLSYDWEYDYCDEQCFKKSNEYKNKVRIAKRIDKKLTNKEKSFIKGSEYFVQNFIIEKIKKSNIIKNNYPKVKMTIKKVKYVSKL
jgi:hypothetical protein